MMQGFQMTTNKNLNIVMDICSAILGQYYNNGAHIKVF